MSVNKVIFIGNVGKVYATDSDVVINFSLASTEKWKDKDGNLKEHVEWISCSVFGNLVKVVKNYVQVGSKLYIEGKLRTEKYTDKEGKSQSSTKVIVSALQLLDAKEKSEPKEAVNKEESFDDSIPF